MCSTNSTEPITYGPEEIASVVLVALITVGVGTSLDLEQARKHVGQKLALVLGVFNQYIFMPVVMWGLSQAAPIPLHWRAAFVIIGTSPGGILSNVMCMWLHTDPALSITLTTWTVLLSLGFLPLNLYIYLQVAGLGQGPPPTLSSNCTINTDFVFTADWLGLGSSCAAIIGGLVLGIAIQVRYKSEYPRQVKQLELFGLVFTIPQGVLAMISNSKSGAPVWAMPRAVYGLLLVSSITAFLQASILARFVFRFPKPSASALAIEASVQNVNVAIGVLSLSIANRDLRAQALGVPLAYATVSLAQALVFGGFLWKLGWTELDPKGRNPCQVWLGEYYREAIKRPLNEEKEQSNLPTHNEEDKHGTLVKG